MPAKLILTRGIQASGKTTYALKYLEEHPEARRVNRDSLRYMIVNKGWCPDVESAITMVQDSLVAEFLLQGRTVLVDDMNLNVKSVNRLENIAKAWDAEIEVIDFTHVPLDLCIERDSTRDKKVGSKVIIDTYNKYLKKKNQMQTQPVFTGKLPKAIICDLDGTLTLATSGRSLYDMTRVQEDSVSIPVKEVVEHLSESYHVIFLSGRHEDGRKGTEQWLADNVSLRSSRWHLLMRKNGDNRRDSIVKGEIFNRDIKPNFEVLMAIDDRSQVVSECWVPNGIFCLRVGLINADNF